MKIEMNKTNMSEKFRQHHSRIKVQFELIEYKKYCGRRKFKTHV